MLAPCSTNILTIGAPIAKGNDEIPHNSSTIFPLMGFYRVALCANKFSAWLGNISFNISNRRKRIGH